MYGGYEVWPSGNLQVIVLISTLVQDADFKVKLGTCTGTLVTPSWILTAAHCFPAGTRKILLEFGGKDAKGRWKCVKRGRQVVFYDEKVIGVHFRLTDLAMVEVRPCAKGPQPMAVRRNDHRTENNISNCTIAGFGYSNKTHENSGTWKSGPLHQLHISNSDVSFVIPGRILLWVGAKGHGPCMGDSGGPLVCDGLLYGVLSRIVHRKRKINYLCGWPNGTAVYEDVADYSDWIEHVIRTRTSGNSAGERCTICPCIVMVFCIILVLEIYHVFCLYFLVLL